MRLAAGKLCDACRSAEAWSKHEVAPIVITTGELEAHARKREGPSPTERAQQAARLLLPAGVAIALTIAGAMTFREYLQPQPAGPIEPMLERLSSLSGTSLLLGILGFVLAVFGMWRMRRGRHFRTLGVVLVYVITVCAAGTLGVAAGIAWWASPTETGWDHLAMPTLEEDVSLLPAERRIQAATVTLVAPSEDGDFRRPAFGTGAVIAREEGRAWIVSCSHVVMPWAAIGAWREADNAQPVWVTFADQRSATGAVRWVSRPPLDVALLEVEIDDPPAPVEISGNADALITGSPVVFVPNPLRGGWMVHRGTVQKRDPHDTPAGIYSLLHTNLPVQPGDSGSGLFDEAGKIVGINTWAVIGSPTPAAISLPAEAMRVIVKAIETGRLTRIDEVILAGPRSGSASETEE